MTTNFDLARVALDATQIKALLQTDPATPVLYGGKSMLLGDALAARMKGEGSAYEPTPSPEPNPQGRGAVRIDPARLTEQQRIELEQTGQIAGFTSTDRNRARIVVRNSSRASYTASFRVDDDGNVSHSGPDLRDFYPDELAADRPQFAHMARRPAPEGSK
jgi:hypothetical protein